MLKIDIKDNEAVDKALKRFKKKFEKTGVLKELRARQAFEKPSVNKQLRLPTTGTCTVRSSFTQQQKARG